MGEERSKMNKRGEEKCSTRMEEKNEQGKREGRRREE